MVSGIRLIIIDVQSDGSTLRWLEVGSDDLVLVRQLELIRLE